MPEAKKSALPRRPRRDWGRGLALVLCFAFALIGAVPLTLGLLVRTGPVRAWAARATADLINRELGVTARYEVRVQAWPMMVGLEHVEVDASDGGSRFLDVERISVRPRPFSLLGGQLDAGDVEVIGPRLRVVVEDGELKNLRYRLPKSSGSAKKKGPPVAPFASLSVTDARLDAKIDGIELGTRELDVDVSTEDGGAYEITLRTGETRVTRMHPIPGREATEDAVDDDVICRLEARARVHGRSLLIRRLSLQGSADLDPDPGTTPSCKLDEADWRAVELRLGSLRVDLPAGGPIRAGGRVHARVPAPLVHRFVKLAHVSGSLTLDLEVDYDGLGRLPRIKGHISGEQPGLDGKVFAKHFNLDVATTSEKVAVSRLVALWADGKVSIPDVTIEPFSKGVPLETGPVTIEGLEFHALLRDLGVHPQAHVAWTLEKGRFEYFRGTLNPPVLEGPVAFATRNFEIYNRPVTDPARGHMMGIKEGVVRGTFVVNGAEKSAYKFPGVILSNFTVETPRSRLRTTVSLGFLAILDIEVHEGSVVELAEMSPLIDIPIAGRLTLKASGRGPFGQPKFTGDIAIKDFMFGGFPVGDLESARAAFEPLVLDLMDAKVRHGQSRMRSPLTRIAFDKGASVLVDSEVDTRDAPGMRVRDLFEIFRFEKDPRFADLDALASGRARVHYALGGAEDRCGGGFLDVRASMAVKDASLFGERYDSGNLDLDFTWDDQAAGGAGMRVDLRSAALRKGNGSVLASARVRHGGFVQGNVIASGIPVSKLDVFGAYGKLFDGTAQLVADLGGTLNEFELVADVDVSKIRIGPASLGPSHVRVRMDAPPAPSARAPRPRGYGLTRCGNPRAGPFDLADYQRDVSGGFFRVSGSLFGGEVALDDLRITRQRHKVMSGKVAVIALDLGTLANLVPGVAFTSAPPKGSLSATLDVESLPFDAPQRSQMALTLEKLDLARQGWSVQLAKKSGPIVLRGDELTVPELRVTARSASGLSASLVAGGTIHKAMSSPDLDFGVRVEPVDLAKLGADIPEIDRAGGSADAELRIAGPLSSLRFTGAAHLRKGELALKGQPITLEDTNVDLEIGGGDVRIRRAQAKVGGGTVSMTGRMPLRGTDAGAVSASLVARGVKLPVADGINLTADAELEASYRPGASIERGQRNLPDIKGTVSLTSFSYTRPIALSLSLSQLGRPQRTSVDTYDPERDVLRFSITLVSPRPLRFTNNLVDMELAVIDPGLVLSGTNQRFGARGNLKILPDSKLQLRSSEFLVREGFVRFEDPLKIAPKVDVRAQTEYRRYSNSTGLDTSAASNQAGGSAAPAAAQAGTATGGLWRITLQANGDADNLKMTLSSDPPLSQEDIVLLLTIGMTRAEIDRGAASSLGETVGLEALSALTGADKAVKTIVPLIDEFRFGTGYSPRTGRSEPTVTIGKRITDNVRASVTTGVGSENRQVRSNVEWRLNRRMSVQASYDNLNDASISPLGNIGVDLRWRLEFE